MHQEFRIAKGWRVFAFILGPVMIVLFGGMLLFPLYADFGPKFPRDVYPPMAIISVAMICLAIIGLVDANRWKLTIENEVVRLRTVFLNRELWMGDIKGYRKNDKHTFLVPKTREMKQIKISKYLGDRELFETWLKANFSDVDELNVAEEKAEIMSDSAFGDTPETRERKLTLTRNVSYVMNGLGLLAVAGALFFTQYYDYVVYYCVAVSLVCIILPIFFKLMRLTGSGTAYPTLDIAIFASSGALFFRSIFDYDIYDYAPLWPKVLMVGVIISLISLLTGRINKLEGSKRMRAAFMIQIFAFLLSYGSIVMYNCRHDVSVPQQYSTLVLDKWVHHGKTTNYDLSLAPWGTVADTETVSVTEGLYDRIQPGQKVNIYVKEGRLKIPWFIVSD